MGNDRRVLIAGAAGRDFHDFNTVFREDPGVRVVAFTAAQIPFIDDRIYPESLAGPRYPGGIPIYPEEQLTELIGDLEVDEVVFSYSDVTHEHVMHLASRALAAGASFTLLGPEHTTLDATVPVVAVCAVRTGAGKSPLSRHVCALVRDAGQRPVVVRHPMPYGDLAASRVQRFERLEDLDAAGVTIEEREEHEPHLAAGTVVYAGVDHLAILAEAEAEADVIVFDGGNNDLPLFRPDVHLVVADPLRAGDELRYHPGETNLRMADVVVIGKLDTATAEQVAAVEATVRTANPRATIVRARNPITVHDGDRLSGARVLVVEDGPTLTHGGMRFGAGTVATQRAGGQLVDPRPHATGSIAQALRTWDVGPLLPAMGYAPSQLEELERTIASTPCDVVVLATPVDLRRLIDIEQDAVLVTYGFEETGAPTIADVLAEVLAG